MPPGDVSLNNALERLRHLSQSYQGAWAVLYRACYPHVLRAARAASTPACAQPMTPTTSLAM